MRCIVCLLLVPGLLVGFGCGVAPPPHVASPVGEQRLADAMESVEYGGHPEGRAGDVMLRRSHAGGVLARRDGTPDLMDDDVSVEARLRGQLAGDPMVGSAAVDVDVDGGVAHLSGDVGDRHMAARALRLAVTTRGVRAVDARLTWIDARRQGPSPRR